MAERTAQHGKLGSWASAVCLFARLCSDARLGRRPKGRAAAGGQPEGHVQTVSEVSTDGPLPGALFLTAADRDSEDDNPEQAGGCSSMVKSCSVM